MTMKKTWLWFQFLFTFLDSSSQNNSLDVSKPVCFIVWNEGLLPFSIGFCCWVLRFPYVLFLLSFVLLLFWAVIILYTLSFFSLCMYLCSTCMWMHVCACMHPYTCMQKPKKCKQEITMVHFQYKVCLAHQRLTDKQKEWGFHSGLAGTGTG